MDYYLTIKKQSIDAHYNEDEPLKHYAKCKDKVIKDDDTLCDTTYIKCPVYL